MGEWGGGSSEVAALVGQVIDLFRSRKIFEPTGPTRSNKRPELVLVVTFWSSKVPALWCFLADIEMVLLMLVHSDGLQKRPCCETRWSQGSDGFFQFKCCFSARHCHHHDSPDKPNQNSSKPLEADCKAT